MEVSAGDATKVGALDATGKPVPRGGRAIAYDDFRRACGGGNCHPERQRGIFNQRQLKDPSLTLGMTRSLSPEPLGHRHRLGERRQLDHPRVPGVELGMARPPRLVGVAEIEIAQGATDRDLADRR